MSAVLLACLIALPQAASADHEERNRERFRGGGERSRIDPDRAASIARQKSGGRVLGVQPGRNRHKVLSPDGVCTRSKSIRAPATYAKSL